MKPYSRVAIDGILQSLGSAPLKQFSQNFLIDENKAKSIVDGLKLYLPTNEKFYILEIGPGIGSLTYYLAQLGNSLICIEKDRSFAKYITETFASNKVSVLESDILKIDSANYKEHGKCVCISNAPYGISSEIILWLLANKDHLDSAHLLFQKEFAERIAATPGTKQYGSLTIQTSLEFKAILGTKVSKESFVPVPNVDSQFLHLQKIQILDFEILDRAILRELVRACFSSRRKTILNSLSTSDFTLEKNDYLKLLELNNIQPTVRAETLSPLIFAKLSNDIVKMIK